MDVQDQEHQSLPNSTVPSVNPTGTPPPDKGGKTRTLILLGIIIICLLYLGWYFFIFKHAGNGGDAPVGVKQASAESFAVYKETPVSVTPQVPNYTVNVDFSNIINGGDFVFSADAKSKLVQNYFVVAPATFSEYYPIYESNRYQLTPNFVTVDSLLHNYHMVFDYLLKNLEQEKLAAEVKNLSAGMLVTSQDQLTQLKGTEWENAAKRDVAFFAVGNKLIDPQASIPSEVASEVNAELKLIDAHQEIMLSPVMNMGVANPSPLEGLKEDYSQYVPRGHYTKSDILKQYFKAMMWYGRLTFRFKNDDEIKSAALATIALGQNKNADSWDHVYEPTTFFVGASDDITYLQLGKVVQDVYRSSFGLKNLASDQTKFASLKDALKNLEAPKLNSMPIFDPSIQPDRTLETKGFRFMGQRFTIDAEIFQRLIYRDVEPKPTGETRYLPKGLDIPAAMGSKEALSILTAQGETQYKNYPENMQKLQSYISGLDTKTWTQNLYWGWLYSLKPLTEPASSGYPKFMQNVAWQRKDLNSYLGSWTELKHDTILYAKQVYAEMGGGGDIPDKDDRGYVEPSVYVYARLASLLQMTQEGLDQRGLLTDASRDNLGKMQALSLQLKTISEKELNNQKLSDEEYELIRSYGGQLEHFWLEANKEEMAASGVDQNNFLNQNPAALVADVATDPNGQVLEEGTGKISMIYVAVPVDGKIKIAVGGVYSYYEFPWPINDRLTDEKWRQVLDGPDAPSLPEWTQSFVGKQ